MTVSKKLLNTIEWVAWPVAILGLGAKWSLLSAGNILLIVGLTTLSTVYFLRAYAPTESTASEQLPSADSETVHNQSSSASTPSFVVDTLLPKYTGIGSAVVFIGVLFKLMNWNGSAMMLIGVATMALVLIIMVFNRRMNARAVVVAALGGIVFYTSPEALVRQFHRDDPMLVQKMIYQIDHPRDRAAAQDVREYLKQKRAQR